MTAGAQSNAFATMGGNFFTVASEGQTEVAMGVAGTFSNLGMLCTSSVSNTQAITFRKNGTNGNETIASPGPPFGNREIFTDNVHTDTVAAGDLVNFAFTGTAIAMYAAWGAFKASANFASLWNLNNGFSSLSAVNVFYGIQSSGYMGQSASEANTQSTITVAGSLSGLFFNLQTNSYNQALTYVFRKNGANGNQSVTIGAGLTGVFQDTTHSDTIAVGDLICTHLTTPGSGAMVAWGTGATFTNMAAPTFDWIIGDTGEAISGLTQQFGSFVGTGVSSLEARTNVMLGAAYRLSNMQLGIFNNTLTAPLTITMRKNAANANGTITVGPGISGVFTDNSNVDVYAATDLVDIIITTTDTTHAALLTSKRWTMSQLFPTAGTAACASSAGAVGVAAGMGAGDASAAAMVSATGITAAIGAGLAASLSIASAAGLGLGIGAGAATGLAIAAAAGLSVAVGAGFAGAASVATAAARSFAASLGNALGAAITKAMGSAIGWLRISAARADWAAQSGQASGWAPQDAPSTAWTPQSGREPVAS